MSLHHTHLASSCLHILHCCSRNLGLQRPNYGLFFGVVGVLPVAFLAALLHGEWLLRLNIVLGVVFTYGTRFLGHYLVSGRHARIGGNDDTHQGVRPMVAEDYSLDGYFSGRGLLPTGEISPATNERLETLSRQLEEVNKKLEEHQEKRPWEEAQRAVDQIREEAAREERKVERRAPSRMDADPWTC